MRLNAALACFPLLVSVRQSVAVQLACMALLVVLALVGRPENDVSPSHYLPLGLLVGVCGGLSMARGAPPLEIMLLVGAAAVAVLACRRCSAETAIDSLVAGLGVYAIVNVLGWVAGIASPAAAVRVAEFETSSALFGERVIFPFARSINEPGILASALLVFVLVAWRRGRPLPWLALTGLPFAGVILLGSNSRFPIMVLVAVSAAVLLVPWAARTLPTVALAAMALPFFLVVAGPIVDTGARWVSEVPFLARGQSAAEIAGLGSRGDIWTFGLDTWAERVDWMHQLVGFGYDGHVESGVVFLYYAQGTFVNDPAALHLHNALLQQMYDTGYVGLAALVVALWMIGRRYTRAGDLPTVALLGVLYLTSAVEVFLVPGFRSTPLLVLLVLAATVPSMSSRESMLSKSAPQPRERLRGRST